MTIQVEGVEYVRVLQYLEGTIIRMVAVGLPDSVMPYKHILRVLQSNVGGSMWMGGCTG